MIEDALIPYELTLMCDVSSPENNRTFTLYCVGLLYLLYFTL